MRENAALIVDIEPYRFGRAIYDITLKFTEEEEAAYQRSNLMTKIIFAALPLFVAYKLFF
ncbi:MAG: hypothetical protein LBS26_03370 [Campylobacteraceae bacterium]|jgi:hypothetical protein|nr:hypothetical protein [Campylobacteraceae bacterium]